MLNYIDMLEKNTKRVEGVALVNDNPEKLFQEFCQIYDLIPAAGGVVCNDQGEVLLIYRRGSWDLPKGKMDDGETPSQTALREVEEEVGINQLNLGDLITVTYHTYRDRKDKRILKPTYWYAMSTQQHEVTPQYEEDIEIAEWRKPDSFLALSNTTIYNNIREVLTNFLHARPLAHSKA